MEGRQEASEIERQPGGLVALAGSKWHILLASHCIEFEAGKEKFVFAEEFGQASCKSKDTIAARQWRCLGRVSPELHERIHLKMREAQKSLEQNTILSIRILMDQLAE